MNESYFDGGLLSLIGHQILASIIILFTLGIGTPWAISMLKSWEVKHTVIDGKRLYFTGTGGALFGTFIKWFLLTIITLGIYSFWLNIKMKQWITKHTHIMPI